MVFPEWDVEIGSDGGVVESSDKSADGDRPVGDDVEMVEPEVPHVSDDVEIVEPEVQETSFVCRCSVCMHVS